ncbi:hypothetical protein EBZ38_16450 [bacterium]|nr:hypothetical protein [bacterium]
MSKWDELKAIKQTRDTMKEINELKARAYDIISALEQLRAELANVNAEIAKKSAEHVELSKKYGTGDDISHS